MNLGFFGPKSKFHESVDTLATLLETEAEVISKIRRVFNSRAETEKDYSESVRLMTKELARQCGRTDNLQMRKSLECIARDWANHAVQSAKLAEELSYVGQRELAPREKIIMEKGGEWVRGLKAIGEDTRTRIERYKVLEGEFEKANKSLLNMKRERSRGKKIQSRKLAEDKKGLRTGRNMDSTRSQSQFQKYIPPLGNVKSGPDKGFDGRKNSLSDRDILGFKGGAGEVDLKRGRFQDPNERKIRNQTIKLEAVRRRSRQKLMDYSRKLISYKDGLEVR